MNKVFLLGEVARLLEMRPHQVAYAISSGLVPEPKLRIGNKRIFQADDIKRLRAHFGKEAQCQNS
jgi:DNA-binding transcriptional MerR regulator